MWELHPTSFEIIQQKSTIDVGCHVLAILVEACVFVLKIHGFSLADLAWIASLLTRLQFLGSLLAGLERGCLQSVLGDYEER